MSRVVALYLSTSIIYHKTCRLLEYAIPCHGQHFHVFLLSLEGDTLAPGDYCHLLRVYHDSLPCAATIRRPEDPRRRTIFVSSYHSAASKQAGRTRGCGLPQKV